MLSSVLDLICYGVVSGALRDLRKRASRSNIRVSLVRPKPIKRILGPNGMYCFSGSGWSWPWRSSSRGLGSFASRRVAQLVPLELASFIEQVHCMNLFLLRRRTRGGSRIFFRSSYSSRAQQPFPRRGRDVLVNSRVGGWEKKKTASPLCGPRLGGGSKTRRASGAGSLLPGVLRYFLRPGQARLRARLASARWRPRSLESSRRRGSNHPVDAEPRVVRQGTHRWRRSSSVRRGRRASDWPEIPGAGQGGASQRGRLDRVEPRLLRWMGEGVRTESGGVSRIAFPAQAPAQICAPKRSSRVLRKSLSAGLTECRCPCVVAWA